VLCGRYQKELQKYPGHPQLLYELSMCYYTLRHYPECSYVSHAALLNEKSIVCGFSLHWVYIASSLRDNSHAGQRAMACRGNVALAHNPQDEDLATMLTLCLRDSGRMDEARQIMSLIETIREVTKNLKELDQVCDHRSSPPTPPHPPGRKSALKTSRLWQEQYKARCPRSALA
jgi:hypothetical protein